MLRRRVALAFVLCMVLSMPMMRAEEEERIRNPISLDQFEDRFITAMEYFCLKWNIPVNGGTIRSVGALEEDHYIRMMSGARGEKSTTTIGLFSFVPNLSAINNGMVLIPEDEKNLKEASAFSMAFLYGISTHKNLQAFIQEFNTVILVKKDWPHVSGYYTWNHGTGESIGLGNVFSEYFASSYTGHPIPAAEFVLDDESAAETRDLIASFSDGSYLCGNPDEGFSPLYCGTYKATAYSSATLRIRRNGSVVFSETITRDNPSHNVKILSGDEIQISGGDILLSRNSANKLDSSTLQPSSNRDFHIQSIKALGDGRTEVALYDAQNKYPYELTCVRKATNDFEKDQSAQGFHWVCEGIGKNKTQIIDYFVPGESYWVWALNSEGEETERLVFSAPTAKPFDGFKTKPKITEFFLKSRSDGSSPINIEACKAASISAKNVEYGAYIEYDYPQLKNSRTYFQQTVFRAPNGFCMVDYAGDKELPAGDYYTYWTFYSFEDFFETLTHGGRIPPTGSYRFELYWDGMLVDFKTFQVK